MYPWKERGVEGRHVSFCGPGLKQVSRLNSQDSQNYSRCVSPLRNPAEQQWSRDQNTNISMCGSASPAVIKQPHRITIKETAPAECRCIQGQE